MSLPNLKDKIEGNLPEELGEPGRSGGVRESPVETPEVETPETVETEEMDEKVGVVPKQKSKGRKLKSKKKRTKK